MDAAVARANFEISGEVVVDAPRGTSVVRLRRLGAWDGSPMWSHWVLLAPWHRLVRFVRREKRWEVVLGPRGGDARVLAVGGSRAEAVERAIEQLERISPG